MRSGHYRPLWTDLRDCVAIKKMDLVKKRRPVKGKTQKKRDALAFFYEAGVPNPEVFYHQFLGTQKVASAPP